MNALIPGPIPPITIALFKTSKGRLNRKCPIIDVRIGCKNKEKTAITTILGLLPMVFALTIKFLEREVLVGAPSSQWWTQLASTIAGGLTFATILTLLATPALLVFGNGTSEFLKSFMNRINYRSRKTSLN